MKQSKLPKLLLAATFFLSLCAFLYVNADACQTGVRGLHQTVSLERSVDEACEEEEAKDLQVPAVHVISRVLALVHKLTVISH